MADFTRSYPALLKAEGGYVLTNTKGDRGGQTYAGISRRWHPDWEGWKHESVMSTPGSTTQLRALVSDFYRKNFWNPILGDQIKDQGVAEAIFLMGVLSGLKTTGVATQQTVNGLVLDGVLSEDGIIGKRTIAELNRVKPELFLPWFSLRQIKYYVGVARKPAQLQFLRGWVNRVLNAVGV